MAAPEFSPPDAPSYQSADDMTFQIDPMPTNLGVGLVRSLGVRNLRRGTFLWNVMTEETREYIQDFIDSLEGQPGPFTWRSFDTLASPVTKTPVLSQVVGGSLAQETVYVVITWYDAAGETTESLRAQFTRLVNNYLVVTVPRVPTGADGWRIYASTTSGAEVLQASVSTSRVWTQSAALATGTASPPTTNTLFPLRRFFFSDDPTSPRVGFDSYAGTLDVVEQLM